MHWVAGLVGVRSIFRIYVVVRELGIFLKDGGQRAMECAAVAWEMPFAKG